MPLRRIRKAICPWKRSTASRELARARFTRVQEFEANLLGALYATRAGFDGFNGALRWMQLEANDSHDEYSMSEYIPKDVGNGKVLAADHPTWKRKNRET